MSRTQPSRALGRAEFIALMAMISATVAFSTDAMLPALPQIASDLAPTGTNQTQLVITFFFLGLGVGTFFMGPLSDAFGRRPVILCSSALFALTSAVAMFAASLEALIAARVLQGFAASGARVTVLAIIRDRFEGRDMAQVLSFVMMVFSLVPAAAPLIGAGIAALFGWRGIFAAFILFVGIYALWYGMRQPETLTPENRRPLRASALLHAVRETLTTRATLLALAAVGCVFGILFGTLSAVHGVYDQTFGLSAAFPWCFALISLIAGGCTMLNGRFVQRLGIRKIVLGLLGAHGTAGLLCLGLWLLAGPSALGFGAFLVWQLSVFVLASACIGNLNAVALQPLGHIAGMAASVVTAVATVMGACIAIPIALSFDGTPVPLVLGTGLAAALSATLVSRLSPEA